MSIIKLARRTGNFVVVDKECLQDTSLPWAARGLHTYLMGLPEGWMIKVDHLVTQGPTGRDAIYSYLNHLINAGYVKRFVVRDVKGRITERGYEVYETKQNLLQAENLLKRENPEQAKSDVKTPHVWENPDKAWPVQANPTLLNNNNTSNTKAAVNTTASLDDLITNALSDNQCQVLLARIGQITDHLTYSANVWFDAVCFELLNPEAFKKCHPSFLHKLNSIMKHIEIGKWTPAQYIAKNNTKKKNETEKLRREFKHQINKLNGEILHAEKMCAYSQDKNLTDLSVWQQEKEKAIKCKEKLFIELDSVLTEHELVARDARNNI